MKPLVFYFTFTIGNDIETTLTKGFIVNNFDYTPEFEDDLYDDYISDIEDQFGVHDWSSRPNDAVNGIGHCTYEVEKSRIDELMETWRQVFIGLAGKENVSAVYVVEDAEDKDDAGIYNYIKEKVQG